MKSRSDILVKGEAFSDLPPEWPEDLMPVIQARLSSDLRKIVVLDDDPTGTQTVHHVPVLTDWSVDLLAAEMRQPGPVFYVLTNSRGLQPEQAMQVTREIGKNLRAASHQTGIEPVVISRSDSTLRGHFPLEIDLLADSLECSFDGCLLIPYFLEGGRFTIHDIHYVLDGERLIPAGETEFAKDATFGYRSSNLRAWISEKTAHRIQVSDVRSISIDTLRRGGPTPVLANLLELHGQQMCVVNAVSYRDLEVLVSALLQAELIGKRYIYRTAASFVRVRSGILPQPFLEQDALRQTGSQGGIVIVGSHVPRTTIQLETLRSQTILAEIEIAVPDLLDPSLRPGVIAKSAERIAKAVQAGKNVLVYTSRAIIQGDTSRKSLEISRAVSSSLVQLIQLLPVRPRFLVAKGGITSSDIATQGLNVKRAMVLGQILPGIPVWQLGPEAKYPGLPYVVFPGNVGNPDSLVEVVGKLTG